MADRRAAALAPRIAYAGRSLAVLATRPAEGLDRIRGRLDLRSDAPTSTAAAWLYEPDGDFDASLHERLGAEWPCEETERFTLVWNQVEELLEKTRIGFSTGLHDASRSLARACWCLVRHRRPSTIIETGVARGVTTRVVLEALEANARGHLTSIDLPPLLPGWDDQSAIAVPHALRTRWTYLRGSSRRRLPRVLSRVGPLDLFIHDSLHTERNMRFEMAGAWEHLRPGGALVADDIATNSVFRSFAEEANADTLIGRRDATGSLFGVAIKREPEKGTPTERRRPSRAQAQTSADMH